MIARCSHWFGTVCRTKALLRPLVLSSLTTLFIYSLPVWIPLSEGTVLRPQHKIEADMCPTQSQRHICELDFDLSYISEQKRKSWAGCTVTVWAELEMMPAHLIPGLTGGLQKTKKIFTITSLAAVWSASFAPVPEKQKLALAREVEESQDAPHSCLFFCSEEVPREFFFFSTRKSASGPLSYR